MKGERRGESGGLNDRSHHRYVTSVKVTSCSDDEDLVQVLQENDCSTFLTFYTRTSTQRERIQKMLFSSRMDD